MRKALFQAAERLTSLTHSISAMLLGLGAVLVFWQVITRFVLGDAAGWSEVLARGVIIWMVFMAIGAGFRQSAMIPLEFVRSVLPPKGQRAVSFAVMVLNLIFLGVLMYWGTLMTMRVSTQTIAMLGIPISWFYAALPIGSLLAVPGVLLEFLRPVADERDGLSTGHGEETTL